jgi:hypothetical protein
MTYTDRSIRAIIRENESKLCSLISELKMFGDDVSFDLAYRLEQCQSERRARSSALPSFGWPFRCRSAACWACRRPIISKWQDRARNLFSGRVSEDCSFATIMLARCGTLYPLHNVVMKLRRDLRNIRDALARRNQTWNSMSLIGHIELDAIEQTDFSLLPPDRRSLIPKLPMVGGFHNSIVWIPHAHVSISHPLIPREYLKHALALQWSNPNQVDVREFYAAVDTQDNAAACMGYSLKFRHSTLFIGEHVIDWPASWSAQFWSWLHSRRRGLQPLQVALGVRTSRADRILRLSGEPRPVWLEPMPVVF